MNFQTFKNNKFTKNQQSTIATSRTIVFCKKWLQKGKIQFSKTSNGFHSAHNDFIYREDESYSSCGI